MPAYVIADIEVLEPVEYEEYRRLAGPTVAQYGGRYIVRGGKTEVAEGDWMPKRFVVLEFPSMEQAKAWYSSPEYVQARAIRQRTAASNVIFADGMSVTNPSARTGPSE
jgi:uncharacterized protein (DUF1330 family)